MDREPCEACELSCLVRNAMQQDYNALADVQRSQWMGVALEKRIMPPAHPHPLGPPSAVLHQDAPGAWNASVQLHGTHLWWCWSITTGSRQ